MMEVQDGAELCFPQLLNTSCRLVRSSWTETALLSTLLSSVSVVTVALNLLVIISVSHFRQRYNYLQILDFLLIDLEKRINITARFKRGIVF